MKKKNILIILGIIVLTGLIIAIIIGIKSSKEAKNNAEYIRKNYNLLADKITKYNEIREEYTNMSKVLLMDSYMDSHNDYVELIDNYGSVVTDIDSYISNINFRCNRLYSDKEINNICNNYKKIYEKLVNLYVNDINSYNDFLDKYNKYKDSSLEKIVLVHKDYIDYDNDGVYEGKIESEED